MDEELTKENNNDEEAEEEHDNDEETELDSEEIGDSGKHKPPIHFIELALLPLPWSILADIIDCVSLTGIGTIISWVLDILSMGIINLWLVLKGRRAEWMMIASGVEFIPGIDILPIRTFVLLFIYFKETKLFQYLTSEKLQKIEEMIEKVEKMVKKS